MSNFYYGDSSGNILGPLSLQDLRGLKGSGGIHPDTPVIMEGEESWSTYQAVEAAIGSIVRGGPIKFVKNTVSSMPWEMAPVSNPLAVELPAWDLVPSDSMLVRRRSLKK